MAELIAYLRAQRAELLEAMRTDLAADRDIHSWVPLLAQIQAALQAAAAVMEERAGPPQMRDNATSLASENAPERP